MSKRREIENIGGVGEIEHQITAAIASHSLWKRYLSEAIETGTSEWTPDFVAPCDNCELGKWLKQVPEERREQSYREVYTLHADFHREASEILKLALEGETAEARSRTQSGSRFAQLTNDLIGRLAVWRQSVLKESR